MRLARGCRRLSRGWHEVCMRSARGWHEVARGFHEVCTRFARGWHEVARGSMRFDLVPKQNLIGYFPITPFQMLTFNQSLFS